MKIKLAFLTVFVLMVSRGSAATITTYYGGFEDNSSGSSDKDYQDIVFSLSSSAQTLTLQGNGTFSLTGPRVSAANNGDGTPYWNNDSNDSGTPNPDVGSCLYQGCVTNRGTVVAVDDPSTLDYYAGASGIAPTSIYFTDTGSDTVDILATISASTDTLGYEVCTGSNTSCAAGGTFSGPTYITTGSFDPCFPNSTCEFILVGDINGAATPFRSVVSGTFQSFALFSDTTSTAGGEGVPEPATLGLAGFALAGLGLSRLRKRAS